MTKAFYVSCLALLLCSSASGEIVHDVFYRAPGGEPLEPRMQLLPGESFDAEIIFRETVSGGTAPIIGETGLGGIGLDLISNGADGRVEVLERPNFQIPANINDDDTIAGASPFGGIAPVSSPSEGVFEAVVGSVRISAPTLAGSETVFSFADPQPTADNFAGVGAGTTLDDSAINFSSVSVTAVPEPGSLLALSALATGGFVYQRRRKSAAKATA
jgi:hypothetical protein